jgi:hypothetical protein
MTSAELITELQSARPAADASLRERVLALAAAEPAPRAWRLPRPSLRRFALVAVPATAVVLLGVAGIAGVLDPGSQSSPTNLELQKPDAASSAVPGRAQAPELKADAGAAPAAGASTPAPTPGRAQSYSAQLTLSVKDVDALSQATQQAQQITRRLGGYIVTVSYATADSGNASLTLKVPTASVQDAIVQLTGLGKIVSQQVQIDDLQGQVDDLTRREALLRGQIARLSAKLAATDLDPATRATLEARRDAARSALAQVRIARAQLNSEARYATIQLNLQTSEASVVPAVPSRWDRTIDRAGSILAVEAMVVLTTLVVVGPLVLLALLAWLGRRGLPRRQDEQLLSAP